MISICTNPVTFISVPNPTLAIGSTELRDAVFRGVLQPKKRDKWRAWKERAVLRVVPVLSKLEDTNGNSQRELPHQVNVGASPHQRWTLGTQSCEDPCLVTPAKTEDISEDVAMDDNKETGENDAKAPISSSYWLQEDMVDGVEMRYRVNRLLLNATSNYQSIQVVETKPFGKTLILDGLIQSTQLDEFIYHESLVHPTMLAHPDPKQVYIGGGGELATAREVLRHKSVEKCVMVDLDKLVVDASKDLLPEWGAGVLDDSRLEVHYSDAHAYLQENDDMYDVIIMDIADPVGAGPGYALYTLEFYEFAIKRLSPGGVLVTQSGPAAVHLKDESFTMIHKTLRLVFKSVACSVADVPSFGCCWGFNMASDSESFDVEEHRRRSPETTDELISSRISGDLQFYDGITHLGMFGTPKWLREAIEKEKRIMTVDNPPYNRKI